MDDDTDSLYATPSPPRRQVTQQDSTYPQRQQSLQHQSEDVALTKDCDVEQPSPGSPEDKSMVEDPNADFEIDSIVDKDLTPSKMSRSQRNHLLSNVLNSISSDEEQDEEELLPKMPVGRTSYYKEARHRYNNPATGHHSPASALPMPPMARAFVDRLYHPTKEVTIGKLYGAFTKFFWSNERRLNPAMSFVQDAWEHKHGPERIGISNERWAFVTITRPPVTKILPTNDVYPANNFPSGQHCDVSDATIKHCGTVLTCQGATTNHPNHPAAFNICTGHHSAARETFNQDQVAADWNGAFVPICISCSADVDEDAILCKCNSKLQCEVCWKAELDDLYVAKQNWHGICPSGCGNVVTDDNQSKRQRCLVCQGYQAADEWSLGV